MAARVVEWAERKKIGTADWLGHSLGGKVALRVASDFPERVRRIVLADIFPKKIHPPPSRSFNRHGRPPLADLRSRKEADQHWPDPVPDWALRQFLLTNLITSPDGTFTWQVNLIGGLRANLPSLADLPFPKGTRIPQKTLLLYGGKSDFVSETNLASSGDWFDQIQTNCLPQAGHNLHVEAKDPFVETTTQFLNAPLKKKSKTGSDPVFD